MEHLFLTVGILIAGFIGIAWLKSRAGGIGDSLSELRSQVQKREEETNRLRIELDAERMEKVKAETRLEEAQKNLDEQKKLVDAATEKLKDTFGALSSEALKSNNQSFLQLAKETMEKVIAETKGDLGKRQEAIDRMIEPLKESLKRYEKQIREMENVRQQAYGGLAEQLKELTRTHEQLQKETTALVGALKTPQVRGRWGEVTLKRVVEIAGMSQHCDFVEQPSVDTEEGRKRPDLIVRLPGDRTVVIDAKVPLKAYMEAMEASEETARSKGLVRHAKAVRTYMQALGSKAYWNQFSPSPDFVVLFLPGESFFSAALEQDRSLIEDGISGRVILATPTTLISLLRTVAYSWQQQQVAENSQRILDTGSELFDRVCKFAQHFGRVREGLNRASQAYNAALGSWETRVVPGARKLKELGASSPEKELPDIEPVESSLRELP